MCRVDVISVPIVPFFQSQHNLLAMRFPWPSLSDWAPFRIDALGLVTLLGSEEVNNSIGRLVPSRWLEYMPLLAAHVVACDLIKAKKPSFYLYKLSSGICTTDLSSWFARWAISQDFECGRSIVYWDIVDKPQSWWLYHLISGVISACFLGPLTVMTVLSNDWYGLTNALGMIVSVLVKAYVLYADRSAIDATMRTLRTSWSNEAISTGSSKSSGSTNANNISPVEELHGHNPHDCSKILLILPDSKAVTMFIPQQLVTAVFVNNPQPKSAWLYDLARWIGWLAFAVHIISLGMTSLASQIYTVTLLITSTILTVYCLGCDDSKPFLTWNQRFYTRGKFPHSCSIGTYLKATIFDWPDEMDFEPDQNGEWRWRNDIHGPTPHAPREVTRRQDLYAWLDLSEEEEASLEKWDLLPHRRMMNERWTEDFAAKKALVRKSPADVLMFKEQAVALIEGRYGSQGGC